MVGFGMTNQPDTGRAWTEYGELVHDMLRGYFALMVAGGACLTVAMSTIIPFGAGSTGPAWMNGVAAVITAVAVIAEARKGRVDVQDHEVRIRVLESKP